MARMGEGGSLYDTFRERSVAAVGWNQLAAHAKPGVGRKQLVSLYRSAEPQAKQGTVVSGASQVWRFVNDIQDGDWVATYSPANRLYSIGKVSGPAEHHPEWAEQGMALARKVQWQAQELSRDSLGVSTKNSLGSTLTLFEIPSSAAAEVLAALKGKPVPAMEDEAEEVIADPLADIESQALERIKDRVNELDWDDMQQLVAGILRAMGYKTQVSPPAPTAGRTSWPRRMALVSNTRASLWRSSIARDRWVVRKSAVSSAVATRMIEGCTSARAVSVRTPFTKLTVPPFRWRCGRWTT